MRVLLIFIISGLLLGCGSNGEKDRWSKKRQEMEVQGQVYLKQARAAFARGDFAKARKTVRQIREHCELAFNAREEGMLLLDSIDLKMAGIELEKTALEIQSDTIGREYLHDRLEEQAQKIKFFQRKLDHDRKSRLTH